MGGGEVQSLGQMHEKYYIASEVAGLRVISVDHA